MRTRGRVVRRAGLAALAMLVVSPALLAAQVRPASGAGDSRVLENAFRQNSAALRPDAMADLDGIAKVIRATPGSTWEIGGYTSSVGKTAQNLRISRRRAEAVKTYLVTRGVPAARLTAVGYGARYPVASNRTAAGRTRNMRVEIRRLPSAAYQATGPQPAVATANAAVAPTAVGPAGASAVRDNALHQNSVAAPPSGGSVTGASAATAAPAQAGASAAVRPAAALAPAPKAAAPRKGALEGGVFGFGVGYESFSTSYWFYGGGNSRWQAWNQFQASGFYEGRAPLRIGAWQTRFRLEFRVGTGGATDAVGSGFVGNGASLTNGSLSGGVAATLRLPLTASTGTQPKPFVGLGVDYSVLWGFGDNGGSMYGKGWNERLLMVPLVAGVNLYTAHLMFRPEIRYAFIGWSSSNLYLSGAGYAMQNTGPTMKGIFVSMSWR